MNEANDKKKMYFSCLKTNKNKCINTNVSFFFVYTYTRTIARTHISHEHTSICVFTTHQTGNTRARSEYLIKYNSHKPIRRQRNALHVPSYTRTHTHTLNPITPCNPSSHWKPGEHDSTNDQTCDHHVRAGLHTFDEQPDPQSRRAVQLQHFFV